jgi:two-component system sensor histidine kinase DesK
MAFTIPMVALAMWGFFGLIRTNQALADARAEVARLAAENERTRIARDLHDLLGHSLTTITVKAGLARRLAEKHDNERAAVEIAEVEKLSRSSLADVRSAVAGHRDVTLVGELATAREVLRAAGVVAELPGSVEIVDPALSELFGWVVREGVTNVVRHARAAHCTIRVDRDWIEISDDGRGGIAGAGNGLTGLRERVEAAGGTVQIGGQTYSGWRLRVDVPMAAPPSEPVDDPTTMSA